MKYFNQLLLLIAIVINCNFSLVYSQAFGNGNLGSVTISNPNQIVNSYYAVSSINYNQLNFNSSIPNFLSQRILIIQMEGPTAGTWEWARISSTSGTNAILSLPVVRTYNTAQKVQIVLVPEYENLTISSGASLTCTPYNPLTGTGGVLAYNVSQILTIEDGGVCDVSGKGYPGGTFGIGGSGGAGGTGGLAGPVGQHGGNTGIQLNTGVSGGGNGGSYGNPGLSGGIAGAIFGLGSGAPASNSSQINANPPRVVLGGAGAGGNGGAGKAGAGGGGGGAGTVGSQNGTNGAAGATGGNGGQGGNGGGIILFSARVYENLSSSPVFIANGTNGTLGSNASAGGNGGNGGIGVNCATAGGGGGGRGGDGANGGNGGSGGAGGTVYGVIFPGANTILASHVSLLGGLGRNGGAGGTFGLGGQNAGTIQGSCPTVNTFPIGNTANPISGPAISPTAICSLEETLLILEQMGVDGTNDATYTFINNVHRWESTNGVTFVEMWEAFPGLNLGRWLVYGVGPNGQFYTNVSGHPTFNFYQALSNLVNQSNVVTYTSTANGLTGNIYNGNQTFTALCDIIRELSENGTPGLPGSDGFNGVSGEFGMGGPECDLANLTYTINQDQGAIYIYHQGLTLNGSSLDGSGMPSPIIGSQDVTIIYYDPTSTDVTINATLTDECGNEITLTEIVTVGTTPPCDITFTHSITSYANCLTPLTTIEITGEVNLNNSNVTFSWDDFGINLSEQYLGNGTYLITREFTPGTYTLYASDYVNCNGTYVLTVDPPVIENLEVDLTLTQPSCNQVNGAVTASVTGGNPPHSYSLDNINFVSSNVFSNLDPSVIYTLYISDAIGCTTQEPFQFQPSTSSISLSPVISQPTCQTPTGTITVNATLGTAPYLYSLNGATPISSNEFTGLSAGNYTVTVTDANGCSASTSIIEILEVPTSSLAVSVETIQPTCSTAFGTITAQANNGTAPYLYALNGQNPTSNPVFDNLTAGTYTIQITDASGCSATSTAITINSVATDLALSLATVQPLCSTGFGSIEATTTGGVAPYTYSINGQPSSVPSFIDLGAGTYTIQVTDANSCSISEFVTINAVSPLLANPTVSQPNCPNEQGTITMSVSGGTAPYLYDFGQGNIPYPAIIAMQGNTYNVVVTDSNNCSVTVSNLSINTIPTWDVQVTTTPEYCSNSNGTITVTVIQPSGNSTILWDDSNTSFVRTNVPSASYNGIITHENGCSYAFDAIVESEKYQVQISETITELACNNGSTASISLMFGNGEAPYSVDWGFTTGTTITNLPAGNYTAIVTDANGCSGQANYVIANPTPISLSATTTNASCYGSCDGTISLNTPSFNLSSLNWAPSANPSALNQTGLCAGNYTVTAISDLGCEVTESYTIEQPTEMTVTLVHAINNSCYGFEEGYIKVQVLGSVGAGSYLWSNNQTTSIIQNLANGTYTLTFTDVNGCTATYQHTITSPSQINLNIAGNLTYCAGSSATLVVTASGGIAPYSGTGTYNFQAGATQITVKDSAGCKVVQDLTIIELPKPNFDIKVTNTCKEQFLGTATLIPIVATQPVTYLWSNSQTTQSISNLSAGVYTVTVTDANGCTNQYTATVTINPAPTISAAITNAGCAPATNGAIVLTVNQQLNNPNVTYLWNTSATTSQLTNIGAGTYSVVVTDEIGCNVQTSFPITNDCGCPLNFSVDICGPTVVCQGESFTLTSNVFPRPQGYPYIYTWTTPLGTNVNTANLSVTGAGLTSTGWYTLTVSLPPNCSYTTQVYVTVRPRPVATISNAITGTVDNYIHMRGCDIDLTATGGVYYNWFITSSPVLNNHTNLLTQPTNASTASTVFFKVTAIDSFGCASQQVQHRVRTANPVISRSLNNTSSNPTIIRTLTMNQTTQFAGATYTWSSNGWNPGSSSVALRQRTGTISQLAGVYTLVINQNGCERTFQFEVLFTGKITPTIEIGTNKMNFDEENETIETEDLFQIKAYPNPVTDQLQFEFENPNNEDIGLVILDNNGRILTDLNVGTDQRKVTIDVSSFATGMYFVQCTRDSIIHREKIKIIKE